MINYKLVYIKWLDSYGVGAKWEELDDIHDEPYYCCSVGWLVGDGENTKTIVPHIAPENKKIGSDSFGCGDMAIPVRSILEIKELKLEDE